MYGEQIWLDSCPLEKGLREGRKPAGRIEGLGGGNALALEIAEASQQGWTVSAAGDVIKRDSPVQLTP